ncbi:phenylacetate--CoA ligase [Candidatus Marsarchaeota G2 archaeon ECH_B_SAG-F08]|jgi:phenylacetate-CoA ligase|uniref:Phenylacetate--CoA ligase n=2 Tax=Candidatus Marsarchaeota group 2 TaxID=2203771 RepID=A0A2R6BGJ6_9ARCH|nr:MAG: phenylacetate--CoA ligase [Candidatus Marsarchaeota G2 archaeon ECH_B_SAG-F08]PSO04590.1 MAG: phenylacetate--CoA ligase [Candidatus Marsarchaeota G2 archaeon ECH_B_SAG-G16]
MPRSELKELQAKRLKQVAKKVYERVKFYHDVFDSIGVKPEELSPENLKKLPFTTKAHLRTNYPYGFLAVEKDEIAEIHMTSGTTGTPVVNYYTLSDIENWGEISARSLSAAGVRKGDVIQITPSFGLFTGGFGFYYGARKIGAFIIPTGPGNSKRQIEIMKTFGTKAVTAVASYMIRLTEVALEMGIDPKKELSVRSAIIGSEPSTKEMKDRLREIWGLDVFDIPGMTETYGPGMGIDCYIHDGLHVWEDHYYFELIDPKSGEVIENPEEKGELVVTTLTKDAMPLIRYRTGDLTYFMDDATHECGRTHRRIGYISGRTDDMIKFRGVNVWPSAIESVLAEEHDVGFEYQIILTTTKGLDDMLIKVESKTPLPEENKTRLAKRLEEKIKEKLLFEAKVEIVNPGILPRVEVGKARRVVDERTRTL